MATIKGILILTPFFSPNIGGVESHLDDLIFELNQKKINSYVLTYSPLTTNISYLNKEKKSFCHIIRFSWFGNQLFPKIEKYPFLDFIYLTPYLFIRSFFWLLFNNKKINIIHSQGFNAAFIGNFLSKVFHQKHICSTHAIYENINGFSQYINTSILKNVDHILCLSSKSQDQLIKWGISPQKISVYKYWINLNNFYPSNLPNNFTVLFIGRLIAKKGIKTLLMCAQKLPKIKFIIVGTGPLETFTNKFGQKYKNIQYLGYIPNNKIPEIYQKASIFCITSQYPEGFGRVTMEAVASGLPVIGSNLGAISEALDNSVSILFKPTYRNLLKNIEDIYMNQKLYKKLQRNCRNYALKNFSRKNFYFIFENYLQLLNKD